MNNIITNYFNTLIKTLNLLDKEEITTFVSVLKEAKKNDNTIYIMGNGGSATTASHFACNFNKELSFNKSNRFKMICLNDNTPTLLAYANDISYDVIFVEQLKNFLKKEDVVIGISGSGNSMNIINAIEFANSIGAITVGLTGFDGGKLKKIAKYSVNTNLNDMQITEDIHLSLCHIACSALDDFKIKHYEKVVE